MPGRCRFVVSATPDSHHPSTGSSQHNSSLGTSHHHLLHSLAAITAPSITLPPWLQWGNKAPESAPVGLSHGVRFASADSTFNSSSHPSEAAVTALLLPPTLPPPPSTPAPRRRFPLPAKQQRGDTPAAAAAAASTAAAAVAAVGVLNGAAPSGSRALVAVPITHQRGPVCSVAAVAAADEASSFAVERTTGRKRVYRAVNGVDGASGVAWEGFEVADEPLTARSRGQRLMSAYFLPQGFPDSVAPQYALYMGWRGVQYFFGGAISVFTTQSLLGALGVAGRYSGEAAAGINWVIKDGAGRLGRLLFARWGRELDCELKQFRLVGDLLMESGAALELATSLAPNLFLPLACTANLAKNLAGVAASATRAPIYRTFALSNNLADITAKGESVANLADIVGTVFGIALSRSGLSKGGCFALLSAGYLVASRQEISAVELPYLNRARLAYSAKEFLRGGAVPGIAEANQREPLLPWGTHNQQRIVLGASLSQACAAPSELGLPMALLHRERYILTYRPEAQRVHILLRDGATASDCLKAAFMAHLFLHVVDGHPIPAALAAATTPPPPPVTAGKGQAASGRRRRGDSSSGGGGGASTSAPSAALPEAPPVAAAGAARPWHESLLQTNALMERLYPEFLSQAEAGGWRLGQTMLNPRETRLLRTSTPLLLASD